MREEAPNAGVHERVEDVARAGAFRALGLALLVGFFLPALGPRGYYVPNIQLVVKGGCSVGLSALLLFPATAGVLTILLAGLARPARSVILLAMGIVSIALPFADTEARAEMLRAASPYATWGGALAFVGAGGVLTGALANARRPTSRVALCVGGLGGLCYLGGLAAPFALNKPEQSSVVTAVNLVRTPGGLGTGVALGLSTALLGAAALVCVANLIRWTGSRALARATLGLFVLALAFGAAAWAAPAFAPLLRMGRPGLWAAAAGALAAAKGVLWFGGLVLLVPVGAADLIVNLARPAPHADAERAPTPVAAYGAPTPSAVERLTQLRHMRDQGLITDGEFETKRRQIVEEI